MKGRERPNPAPISPFAHSAEELCDRPKIGFLCLAYRRRMLSGVISANYDEPLAPLEDRARFRQYIVLIPPPDQRN